MTFKQIKTGIINPDTDDGEISIFYMPGPDGMIVWFEDGYSTLSEVPLEVIKIAAEKIKYEYMEVKTEIVTKAVFKK